MICFRGGLAVGFFGNEEGNKGVQTTSDALQDTNDTLTNSVKTVSHGDRGPGDTNDTLTNFCQDSKPWGWGIQGQ